jgi:zeta-carotene desaturase
MSSEKSVSILGAGIAGMSAAVALAEAGFRVQLLERRGYPGGRASSYLHPGTGEIIDNCQHALIGCYTNLIGFYRRIGVEQQIHWTSEMTMIEPGGRRSVLGPSSLPAPLHGMPKLLSAAAFNWRDKLSLARAFSAMMRPEAMRESNESLGAWLRRMKQSEGAMNRFWRLVIASALNAELDTIALPYATKVIRELFMNSAEAGAMGMSRVPLSQLYAPVEPFLTARGGSVHFNTHVDGAEWREDEKRWRIQSRTGDFSSDYLLLALPFEALGKLLPNLPEVEGREALAAQISQHVHWPICSVHLWFDREITDLEHAVLLDREVHWMYNQSRLQTGRGGHYIELVISATRTFAALERRQAIDLALKELAEFFPKVKEAKLEKVALVKEVRATFGVAPGIDAARPHARGPWTNSFLAGDWAQTGWPSTMESAARSGHLAAEALAAQAGVSLRVHEADLKPKGLMRFLPGN